MFHNRAIAGLAKISRDNRPLTAAEVRSIEIGDLVDECDQWCRIETLDWSESVGGHPIAQVCAVGVDTPLLRTMLDISVHVPARRVRFN